MPEPRVITLIHDLLAWLSNEAAPVVLWATIACAVSGIALTTIGITARTLVRRARGRAASPRKAGRYLQIMPPWHPGRSDRDTYADAVEFWTEVSAAVRSVWWRPVRYVVYELTVTHDGLQIGLWVPDQVDATRIAHAITSAWRGATVDIVEPNQVWDSGDRTVVVRHLVPKVGLLASAHTASNPLTMRDPLRRVVDQARYLQPGDACVLRLAVALARPPQLEREATRHAPSSALRQLREDVRRIRSQFPSLAQWWHGSHSRPAELHSTAPAKAGPASNPSRLEGLPDRPIWIVNMLLLGVVNGRRARTGLRLVDEVAGAFESFRDRTGFAPQHGHRPLRQPGDRRPPDRGFLVTNTELAGLAHLPTHDDSTAAADTPTDLSAVPDSLILDEPTQPATEPAPELATSGWAVPGPTSADHGQSASTEAG